MNEQKQQQKSTDRVRKHLASRTPEKIAADKERMREYQRKYCEKNRAKRVKNTQKWFAKFTPQERALIRKQRYEKTTRLKNSIYNDTRRARKKNASGKYTSNDIRELFLKQKGKCAWCLEEFGDEKPTVDHYIPLSKGGTNDKKNLRLLHKSCNSKKSATDPIEFGLRNGTLLW